MDQKHKQNKSVDQKRYSTHNSIHTEMIREQITFNNLQVLLMIRYGEEQEKYNTDLKYPLALYPEPIP